MLKKILKNLIPGFVISWYHFLLAFFSALIYGFPGRKLIVIGVTGTSGKTTTINLAHLILEQTGQGVASASSIIFKINNQEQENKLKMTMPGRGVLQKFLRDAARAGCKYAVIEATSEGALQHRHRFIGFDAMVFTNLHKEHIERHGSFENYRKAKLEYFKRCKKLHIINLDDKQADYFLRFKASRKYGYGLKISNFQFSISKQFSISNFQKITAKDAQASGNSLKFFVKGMEMNLNMFGEFNVYNALAAICIGLSQGVSLEQCQQALKKAKGVAGRMEEVISSPIRVVVDYAFTPNALGQVYRTLRKPDTNLICVLGACGGGRDKWKRPELGKIANRFCKEIIITNEDPYDEDPMEIIEQVAGGAGSRARKILDRREAIKTAIKSAQPNDTIIITGKGCEPWICVAHNKKIPWDDRLITRQELDKIVKEKSRWAEIRKLGTATAKKFNIKNDDDVERIVDELRSRK